MKHLLIVLGLMLNTTGVIAATEAPAAAGSAGSVSDWNLSFGIGVEQYRDEYVDKASIHGDQRLVVIDKTYETRPSAWLTVAWNVFGFGQRYNKLRDDGSPQINSRGENVQTANLMFGLFAGTKVIDGDESAFSAFALGPQMTFRLQKKEINIGIGWVTHQTKRLANGIVEGQALPEQYDDVSYREGTENSYMLMMSMSLFE